MKIWANGWCRRFPTGSPQRRPLRRVVLYINLETHILTSSRHNYSVVTHFWLHFEAFALTLTARPCSEIFCSRLLLIRRHFYRCFLPLLKTYYMICTYFGQQKHICSSLPCWSFKHESTKNPACVCIRSGLVLVVTVYSF